MEPLHPNLKIKEIKCFRQKDDGMGGKGRGPWPDGPDGGGGGQLLGAQHGPPGEAPEHQGRSGRARHQQGGVREPSCLQPPAGLFAYQ